MTDEFRTRLSVTAELSAPIAQPEHYRDSAILSLNDRGTDDAGEAHMQQDNCKKRRNP